MKKKELSPKEVQEMFDLMAVKRSRMEEIDGLARKENRALKEAEVVEFDQIQRELRICQDKVDAWKNAQAPLTRNEIKAAEAIADIVRSYTRGANPDTHGLRMENNTIYLERAEQVTTTTEVNAIQPDSVHELLEPLQKALIVDKLGIRLNTNIVGTRKYPSANNIEASIEGETTKLVGQKIVFTATSATPKRIGISVPFSRTSLHQANIDLIAYAIRLMNKAAAQLINKVMFSTTKVTSNAPEGCFVKAAGTKIFAKTTELLTESDLIDMEIAVLGKEVEIDETAAYTCGAKAYGELKKMRDPQSGDKIMVGNTVNGYPVFVSNHVETDGIGFGVFSLCELNQYGPISIVIDNLSRSKEDITEVNFNMSFDTETVRPEGFVYGTFKKAQTTAPTTVIVNNAPGA